MSCVAHYKGFESMTWLLILTLESLTVRPSNWGFCICSSASPYPFLYFSKEKWTFHVDVNAWSIKRQSLFHCDRLQNDIYTWHDSGLWLSWTWDTKSQYNLLYIFFNGVFLYRYIEAYCNSAINDHIYVTKLRTAFKMTEDFCFRHICHCWLWEWGPGSYIPEC